MKKDLKRYAKIALREAAFFGGAICAKSGFAIVATTGYVYKVPRHMNGMDYAALTLGRYEKAEIKILRDHFCKAANIIEVGANIGIVTRVAIMEKLEKEGRYLAVEPNPYALDALYGNIRMCKGATKSKGYFVVNAALCGPEDNGKTGTLNVRPNLSSGLASHTRSGALGPETPVQVTMRSLSSLLDRSGMESASLIIDAEGAEIDMLADTKGLKRIDQMAIELHETSLTGREETPNDVLQNLQKQGFKVAGREANTYYLYRPERFSRLTA
ncbi:MAG: FkbM family methyltransferase [Alphaproteobacteria bacterium]|nr:FkbM family methyltransferase [Alphaproteobacteria bacterium]